MNTDSVLPVLFELLIKSALISLAAALLTRAWRSATAAQRHLVWLVALATIIMLPTTRFVAPFWKIPLAPARQIAVRATLPNAHLDPTEVDSSTIEMTAPASVAATLDWRKVLLGIWLGGAVLLLARRLFGSWRLHRLMRRSTPLDDPRIRLLLSRTLSELVLHRRPEIRLSEECRVPLTWGSLRPVMLLPKAALQWNDTWLTAALRHEAAHIRRCDYLTRWFAHIACAIYWPNPLVWLLARSLRVAQELAADDLVLRAGTPPEEYASQLVDAARAITTHGFFVRQAVAMACPSTLEDRVRAIVDGRRDRRPLSRLAAACGSLTIALMFVLSTAAQLRSDERKPESAAAPAINARNASADQPAPPAAAGPQIEIEAKFMEITTPPGKTARPVHEKPLIYSDPQFQVLIRELNQRKGMDLLSAPRVITGANQRAEVEIIREFHSPGGWEKDGRKWESTKSETKNIGVTLEVTPQITQDGAIELHAVTTMVEFEGFVDLDNADAATPKKKGPSWMASELPTVPAGHRSKPIFSERKNEKTVTLKSGETVEISDVREAANGKAPGKGTYRRQTIVFISARILDPVPGNDAATSVGPTSKDSAAAPSPPPTSITTHSTITFEKGNGPVPSTTNSLTLNGVITFSNGGTLDIPAADANTAKAPEGLVTREWKIPPRMIPSTSGAADVSTKEWLISKGVRFDGTATASYIPDTGRLVARNTPEQLDLVDKIVRTVGGEAIQTPKTGSNQGELTINSGGTLTFNQGNQTAVVSGATPGLINLNGGTLVFNKDGKSADGTLVDAGTLNFSGNIAVTPKDGTVDSGTANGTTTVSGKGRKTPGGAEGPALAKAKKIIIPKIELREVTLEEVLEVLRKNAVEFDPEKIGVKIVVKPGTVSDAKMTLSLTNVPLIEALKYVTSLAKLEFVAAPDALVVQPAGAEKSGAKKTPKGQPQ